jgi:hypothetical protein
MSDEQKKMDVDAAADNKEEKKAKGGRKAKSKSADAAIGDQSEAKVEGKRSRKTVERLTVAAPTTTPSKTVEVPEGKGKPLGDLFEAGFEKSKTDSEWIEVLHRTCYGKPGTSHNRKSNLKKFKGFAEPTQEFKEKKIASLAGKQKDVLHKSAQFLNLEVSGDKTEIATRIVEFLAKPADSGKDYKFMASKKRKSTKSKGKKDKKDGPSRGPNSFMIFSNEKRAELKNEKKYKDMPPTELSKVIGALWNKLSDEDKEEYKKKAAKAKPSDKKAKSKTPKKASKSKTKKSKKEKKADETESEDEEEEEGEEEKEQPKKKKAKKSEAKSEAKDENADKIKEALTEVLKTVDFEKDTVRTIKDQLKAKGFDDAALKANNAMIKTLIDEASSKQADKKEDKKEESK